MITSITSSRAIQDFLFHCQYEKNLAEKTLSAYRNDLGQFQSFLLESSFSGAVVDIGKLLLRAYLKQVSEISKPKTVKRKFATLKAFFNFLELDDQIVVSPFRKMQIKIVLDQRLPVVMTLAEVKRLFEYLYEQLELIETKSTARTKLLIRDIAILEMLFATGMRVAELAHLTCKDVDLESGSVLIFGKGRKERSLPLCNSKVLKSLTYYLQTVQESRRTDRFFLGRDGMGITEQTVRILVEKHTKKAGLSKKITPHTFRHTVATLLLENGVGIRNIQKILGHSSITTTEIYAKVNPEAQRVLIGQFHPREMF